MTDLCSHIDDFQFNPMYAAYPVDVCAYAESTNYSGAENFSVWNMAKDKVDNFDFSDFLNYPEVQQYLNVQKTEFVSCNTTFASMFWPGGRWEDSRPKIREILDNNIKVLFFSGN